MVKFNSTKVELNLIYKIVARALIELSISDSLSLTMDLDATHSNGTPLDFERLLAFDAFNFAHDIHGIMACINRETGELTRCFLPRCSKAEE